MGIMMATQTWRWMRIIMAVTWIETGNALGGTKLMVKIERILSLQTWMEILITVPNRPRLLL
jgi:hypothetical protein